MWHLTVQTVGARGPSQGPGAGGVLNEHLAREGVDAVAVDSVAYDLPSKPSKPITEFPILLCLPSRVSHRRGRDVRGPGPRRAGGGSSSPSSGSKRRSSCAGSINSRNWKEGRRATTAQFRPRSGRSQSRAGGVSPRQTVLREPGPSPGSPSRSSVFSGALPALCPFHSEGSHPHPDRPEKTWKPPR